MGSVAKYAVSERQNLFDLAMQHCGDVAAVFELAFKNGLSVTDALIPGQLINLVDVRNSDVNRYYLIKGLKPATDVELDENGDWVAAGEEPGDEGRIFDIEFPVEWE